MAIIVPSANLLVLQVPGTASTSIGEALLAINGAYSAGPKHCTRDELATCRLEGEADPWQALCTCFVRNPFDIIHAEWHRCRMRWVFELDDPKTVGSWSESKRLEIKMACANDFDDYVQWLFADAVGQKSSLFRHYTDNADVIFKSENMPEFEDWLQTSFGLSVKVPKVNATQGRREYWRDYSRTARRIVSDLFSDEIERLGYHF